MLAVFHCIVLLAHIEQVAVALDGAPVMHVYGAFFGASLSKRWDSGVCVCVCVFFSPFIPLQFFVPIHFVCVPGRSHAETAETE